MKLTKLVVSCALALSLIQAVCASDKYTEDQKTLIQKFYDTEFDLKLSNTFEAKITGKQYNLAKKYCRLMDSFRPIVEKEFKKFNVSDDKIAEVHKTMEILKSEPLVTEFRSLSTEILNDSKTFPLLVQCYKEVGINTNIPDLKKIIESKPNIEAVGVDERMKWLQYAIVRAGVDKIAPIHQQLIKDLGSKK